MNLILKFDVGAYISVIIAHACRHCGPGPTASSKCSIFSICINLQASALHRFIDRSAPLTYVAVHPCYSIHIQVCEPIFLSWQFVYLYLTNEMQPKKTESTCMVPCHFLLKWSLSTKYWLMKSTDNTSFNSHENTMFNSSLHGIVLKLKFLAKLIYNASNIALLSYFGGPPKWFVKHKASP